MAEADLLPHRNRIATIKAEWDEAFRLMQRYYESEAFTRFRIAYSAATWYQFNNPALIFPEEREMRFSTPNAQLPFDYYPSLMAKCGIMGHNFAYLADIEEYYPYNFPLFLWEQREYVTPLQRANLRAAHFMPDALVAVTREGLRSFLKARGVEQGMGDYEEPLVIMETLGLLGMPRRDDIPTFFKEMSEAEEATFRAFLETPYIFSVAGLATPPALNDNEAYGIRSRGALTHVKALVGRYVNTELTYEELNTELKGAGYTTYIGGEGYRPVDSVDLRRVNLDPALERLKRVIAEYEHKAAHSNYYCYADMADALRSIYEKEETARQSYG
jgi:hypothetical protein